MARTMSRTSSTESVIGLNTEAMGAPETSKPSRRPLGSNLPGAPSLTSYVTARSTTSSYKTARSHFTEAGSIESSSHHRRRVDRIMYAFARSKGGAEMLERTIMHRDSNVAQKSQVPQPLLVVDSEWTEYLRERGILLDPLYELDWSGWDNTLSTNPAKRLKYHSTQRRVVGTYTLRKDLAILLYPAAEYNLEQYMDHVTDTSSTYPTKPRSEYLSAFMGCLSRTVRFLHESNVKHMDIKPRNILIRRKFDSIDQEWKVYLADFGIARAYSSAVEAESGSPISYTRTYTAPEVVMQEKRGFGADIFSLGCVFIDMVATLGSCSRNDCLAQDLWATFHEKLRLNANDKNLGDSSYQANIDRIRPWLMNNHHKVRRTVGGVPNALLCLIPRMIDRSPDARPKALEITSCTDSLACGSCSSGTEPFESARIWQS
ncbi:dual specificity mitogen-activated protein kinase kinase 1 [Paraphaeosphaeria sporulosa]